MRKVSIMAVTIVKNEENWVWYAISSVLPYVDKILVYDTGSTDSTVKIIKSIRNTKITLKKRGNVDEFGMTRLRQEMLEATDTDWFMVLDGDEVWPKSTMVELLNILKKIPDYKKAILASPWFPQGDIFHYAKDLESLKTPYGRKGYWHVRIFRRNIRGLHAVGVYPNEGFSGEDGRKFSEHKKEELIFLRGRYFHMTFLPRSSTRKKDMEVIKRSKKTRYTKGASFSRQTRYPEVFYATRPSFVPLPWRKFDFADQLKGIYFRTLSLKDRLFSGRKP